MQETFFDAAVMGEEGMDWSDFQSIFDVGSVGDLSAYESGLANGEPGGWLLEEGGKMENFEEMAIEVVTVGCQC